MSLAVWQPPLLLWCGPTYVTASISSRSSFYVSRHHLYLILLLLQSPHWDLHFRKLNLSSFFISFPRRISWECLGGLQQNDLSGTRSFYGPEKNTRLPNCYTNWRKGSAHGASVWGCVDMSSCKISSTYPDTFSNYYVRFVQGSFGQHFFQNVMHFAQHLTYHYR